MINALRFVKGSIAIKDIVPGLTHFCIENSRVKGFNGTLALSSPIPFDISCKPKADVMLKAIGNCTETIQLTLTKAGRLSIKSGPFKVNIECIQENTPHPDPEGERVEIDGAALLAGLKAVSPFIGQDASRKWAQGVLIRDGSLFATNNIILVQYWLGVSLPSVVNLPLSAVREMVRIGIPPLYMQLTETSVTFHYEGDRWLRTQLYSVREWPDFMKILDRASTPTPIDTRLFDGLEVIKTLVDEVGSIYFNGAVISTHLNMDNEEGATYIVPELFDKGCYNVEMLQLLKGSVDVIDWSLYPMPAIFMKGCLRGAIVGIRRGDEETA